MRDRILELITRLVPRVREIKVAARRGVSRNKRLDAVLDRIAVTDKDDRCVRVVRLIVRRILRPLETEIVDRVSAEAMNVADVIRIRIDILRLESIFKTRGRSAGSASIRLASELPAERQVVVLRQLVIETSRNDVADIRCLRQQAEALNSADTGGTRRSRRTRSVAVLR